MKKVLFTATVDSHINNFHLPYLEYFQKNSFEVHVATNSEEAIPYCDVKHNIPFNRNPLCFDNMKAIFQLRKILHQEHFDIIHCHTPVASVVTRLATMKTRRRGSRVLYTAHGFHFYSGASVKIGCCFFLLNGFSLFSQMQ